MTLKADGKALPLFALAAVLCMFLNPVQAGAIDTSAGDGIQLVIGANTGSPASPPGGAQSPPLGPPPSVFSGEEYGPDRFGRGPGGPMPGYARRQQMASYLGLTKEQTARMRDIWNLYYSDTRNLKFDLAEKWLEMHRLYTDPKAGPAALMAKEKEMISIRDRLTLRRAQAMIDARSILTPEQMQRLDVMVMSRYGGGMGRMGQGMTAGHDMGGEAMGPNEGG